MKRARALAGPLLVVALTIGLWLPRLRGPIDLRFDAGVYYVLGTSLAEGRGYRLLNEPGEIEAIQYPPLLPLLVAAHVEALGTSDPAVVAPALRRTYFALALAFALATWYVARGVLPPLAATFAAIVSAASVFTFYLSDALFAELPFALVAALFLLAMRSKRRGAQAWAGLLAAAAFLLRTAGLALLVAWAAEPWFERRARSGAVRAGLARAALALVPLLGWQIHVARVRSGPEYERPAYAYQRAPYQYYNVSYAENAALVDPFVPELGRSSAFDLPGRAVAHVPRLVVALGESASTARKWWEWPVKSLNARFQRLQLPEWLSLVPPFALGLLVLAGAVGLARAGRRAEAVVLGASLGLIALTPWPAQYPRYLMPLTPLTAAALAAGLCAVQRRIGRAAVGAIAAAVLLEQAYTLQRTFARHPAPVELVSSSGRTTRGTWFYYDLEWQAFSAALGWLRQHADPRAIVVTSAPHFAYLVTGLRAVLPPLEHDAAEAERLIESVPADYVIVDRLAFADMSQRYTDPAVRARPEAWERVYADEAGGVSIWRRR
jgi:hypothetical protein